MSFDIFRVDWILIDTIISILLIIFLMGVNILKKLYRWRFPLSNLNLEQKMIMSQLFNDINVNKCIKKCILTYPKDNNNSIKGNTIFICRTFRRYMLLNALTEGLSSFGFNIINIWFNKRINTNDVENRHKNIFSSIIEQLNATKLMLSENYFIIASGCISSKNDFELINSDNLGVIIINPNMKEKDIIKICEISKFYGIYSEKLILFIRNPFLKRILKLNSQDFSEKIKIKVIKDAKGSYRYQETILLGELIKYLKDNSNK
jgi:hypothetical protein